MYLVIVLEDGGGSVEVHHAEDDQFTVAGKLVALLLKKFDLLLLIVC